MTGVLTLGGVTVIGAGTASAAVSGTKIGSLGANYISAGATNQGADDWLLRVPNTFVAGDTLTIQVADNQGATVTNCSVANQTLGFSTTPSASAVAESGASASDTAPVVGTAVSAATGEANCATQGDKDLLTLTFQNTATGNNADYFDITVANVAYVVGAAAHTGPVAVNFNGSGWNTTPGTAPDLSQTSFASLNSSAYSNAQVQTIAVSANSPAVGVAPSATNTSISNVVVTEAVAGALPPGYVCIALSGSGANTFSSQSTPTVTASGGGATAANAAYVTVSGKQNYVEFNVTKQSAGTPATFTLSGLAVNAAATKGPVTLTATDGASADCTTTAGTSITPAAVRAFDILAGNRIQGSDADATAIAEVQSAYTCATINNGANAAGGAHATVVLATDQSPFDALAASFMAGHLGTGILLTPTGSLSSETQAALRQLGVANVIVVGGTQAVSDAVVGQLQALQAFDCSGTPQTSGSGAQTLQVSRVFGPTALDTAADIASYFPAGAVRSAAYPGAYGSTYNDTTGKASTSGPTSGTRTAILATDNGFADAVSASALAYNSSGGTNFPILLTDPLNLSSQAQGVLTNLNITQVILLGGTQAISDNVVNQLIANGISVLRVAGQDMTDTSQMLAQFELNNTNTAGKANGLDWLASYGQSLYVARGDYYTDGLVGGVPAGLAGVPLVLTFDPNTVGKCLTTFLNTAGATGSAYPVTTVTVLGGVAAITPATLNNLLSAISTG